MIPMLFSGGLVSTYMVNTQVFHLQNTYLALILPGLYYDITDLVQKETPALYKSIGKYWDCATVNGRIMGIPIMKNMGAENMFRLNADYFEGQKGMEIPGYPCIRDRRKTF